MIKNSWFFFLLLPFLLCAKTAILIQDKILSVEVAQKNPERVKGLMHRKYLPENEGMLFIFDQAKITSFWMKDTPLDLSIGFFNENKELIQIEHMNPQKKGPYKTYTSKKPIKYALEVNQGWFEKNHIPLLSTFEFVDF